MLQSRHVPVLLSIFEFIDSLVALVAQLLDLIGVFCFVLPDNASNVVEFHFY